MVFARFDGKVHIHPVRVLCNLGELSWGKERRTPSDVTESQARVFGHPARVGAAFSKALEKPFLAVEHSGKRLGRDISIHVLVLEPRPSLTLPPILFVLHRS